MRIGSLFSGIGGLELGLEWAGVGHTVWQVELDPYCRSVLARHWPQAKRYDDVRKVGSSNLEPVDLICGGFPCQDISAAGKRIGLQGARSGLWYEYLRVVSELQPRWVVVENVASGANAWVDAVTEGLAEQGYQVLPIPISAADCGAWHQRKRVFIVAYLDRDALWQQPGRSCGAEGASSPVATNPTAHSMCEGPQTARTSLLQSPLARSTSHVGWETEPQVVRVVHGFSGRVDRIRALGNSVVPQCAQVVGEVIKLISTPVCT